MLDIQMPDEVLKQVFDNKPIQYKLPPSIEVESGFTDFIPLKDGRCIFAIRGAKTGRAGEVHDHKVDIAQDTIEYLRWDSELGTFFLIL